MTKKVNPIAEKKGDKMKYFSRKVTKREPINKYGKLGFVVHNEYVKTNNIAPFNKRLRNPFTEISRNPFLLHAKKDHVIDVPEDISSSEAYFRKPISKKKRF